MSCNTYSSASFSGGNLTLVDISGNQVSLNLAYAEARQIDDNNFVIQSLKSGSKIIPISNTLLGGSALTLDKVNAYIGYAKYYGADNFVGFETLTAGDSVLSLNSAQYGDAGKAVIQVTEGEIRWLPFGATTPPTTTSGMLWTAESGLLTLVTDLSKIRIIRNGATNATVNVLYAE